MIRIKESGDPNGGLSAHVLGAPINDLNSKQDGPRPRLDPGQIQRWSNASIKSQ
jgi:hypothetical protein